MILGLELPCAQDVRDGTVAVEVLGVITRVGHSSCARAVYHVHHTGSLRGR